MLTLNGPAGRVQAQTNEAQARLALMPVWHDCGTNGRDGAWHRHWFNHWLRRWPSRWRNWRAAASATDLHSPPSLSVGRARRWWPDEAGLLCVSAGRLWLTAWAPQAGGSADIVLCAGQALWVSAGQGWLIEALDAGLQLHWQSARWPGR